MVEIKDGRPTGGDMVSAIIDQGIDGVIRKITPHKKELTRKEPQKTAAELAKEVAVVTHCDREHFGRYIKFRYDRVKKELDVGMPAWGQTDKNTITGVYEKNNPQLNLIIGAEEVSKEAEIIHIAITNFLNQN